MVARRVGTMRVVANVRSVTRGAYREPSRARFTQARTGLADGQDVPTCAVRDPRRVAPDPRMSRGQRWRRLRSEGEQELRRWVAWGTGRNPKTA